MLRTLFPVKLCASQGRNAPFNVKPAGGGRAYDGILTFSKKLLSNSLPRGKNVRSNVTEIPRPGNDLWSRPQTKIQMSLPPGQQDNSNALPPAKAIDQNPALCPAPPPPPTSLTLIGA